MDARAGAGVEAVEFGRCGVTVSGDAAALDRGAVTESGVDTEALPVRRGDALTLVEGEAPRASVPPTEPAEPVVSAKAIGIAAAAEPMPSAIAKAPTRPTQRANPLKFVGELPIRTCSIERSMRSEPDTGTKLSKHRAPSNFATGTCGFLYHGSDFFDRKLTNSPDQTLDFQRSPLTRPRRS